MDGWVTLLLGGGLLVGLAALLTVFARRRTDRDTDAQARFAQNIELNKYIDTKTAPLEKRIADLETELKGFRSRDDAVKNVLRSFFQRLQWWDEIGRPGKMPMPSAEDMATLDLDLDLELTPTKETP